MPSPDARSIDLPIQVFGGKVSQYDPQTLPPGASPFCQDVIFSGQNPSGTGLVAGVATRPGLAPFYNAPFASNPSVNYLRTFVDALGVLHELSLDGLGNLRDESPQGTFTTIGSVLAAAFSQSDTLAGREWLAFGTGLNGDDLPRSYDGTYFDRVSQDGPGAGPVSVADISSPIVSIQRIANIISVVTLNPHGVTVGTLANIAGITGDGTLNGQFPVLTTPSATQFTAFASTATYVISSLVRAGGIVTAILAGNAPNIAVAATIVLVNTVDPSYSGTFSLVSINGTTLTWNQSGPNSSSYGGGLYAIASGTQLPIIETINNGLYNGVFALFVGVAADSNLTGFGTGSIITITGSSNAACNVTATVSFLTPPIGSADAVNLACPPLAGGYFVGYGGTVTLNGLGNSGPYAQGIAGPAGSIDAGLHQLSVTFVTRKNFITKPSPPIFWVAAGGFQASVTGIPTGPSNIIQRILICTGVITPPATSGSFFYLDGPVTTPSAGTYPSMVIQDNATAVYTINFLSSILENDTNADVLFSLSTLGQCAGVKAYSNRLFWIGELNKLPNFQNLAFDGGFNAGIPLGWIQDATLGTGAGQASSAVWGGAFEITGDGVSAFRGLIYQSAYQDWRGVSILLPNTAYSLRCRVRYNPGGVIPIAGYLAIQIVSPSLGTLGQFSIQANTLTSTYAAYSGVLMNAAAAIPSDAVLQILSGATLTNGSLIDVDDIQIYPTGFSLQGAPVNRTIVRASYAGDFESYDSITGLMVVGQDNGQACSGMFRLLDDKLYIVKERSLYVTADDQQNEPSLWPVTLVSDTVGTPSVNGVGVGESWAIIAAKQGVYIFWGSEPVEISREIYPDWATVNWQYASRIYVVVDTLNKRIHVGAPVNGSEIPNVEFVCDYSQLANSEGSVSAQDIASHPQAYYSVYNPTKVVAPGKARKWTLWNVSANCASLALRNDGSVHLLRGNAVGNGKVYDQVASQLSDDGVAINSQYQTCFFPQAEDEMMLQLGSHRKHCKFLTGYAFGAGTMTWTMYGAQQGRAINLSPLTLQNPAIWDFEKNVAFTAERMSLLFGTNAVGSWFELTKLCPTIQRELMTPVRGVA